MWYRLSPAQIAHKALERPVAPSMSESNVLAWLSNLRGVAVPNRRYGKSDAQSGPNVNTFGAMNFHSFFVHRYAVGGAS